MSNLLYGTSRVPFDKVPTLELTALPTHVQRPARWITEWKSGAPTYTIYTSGSTGSAKPFVLKRELLEASALVTADVFKLTEEDTMLCCLNSEYVGGLMTIVRALVLGCDLYVTSPSKEPLEQIPLDIKIDFASFAPIQLAGVLRGQAPARTHLDRMKASLVGGAPVSNWLIKELQSVKSPVYQTYGMTETYSHVAIRRLNGPELDFTYRPVGNVQIGKTDEGLAYINGVVTGGQDIHTNDIIDIHDNGSFTWVGRADFIINSGGIKINPENIEVAAEDAMQTLGLHNRAVLATGIPDEELGHKLVLIVEGENMGNTPERELLEEMKRHLGEYELPKEVIYIDDFARTETGKILRKETGEKINSNA